MTRAQALNELKSLVSRKDELIALWSSRLSDELPPERLRGRSMIVPLVQIVDELGRLLDEGGEQPLKRWAQAVSALASLRYGPTFDFAGQALELKTLEQALFELSGRLGGSIDPAVADLVAELVGGASIVVQRGSGKMLRAEAAQHQDAEHRAGDATLAADELRQRQARLFQRTRSQALGQLAVAAAHSLNNLLNVLRLRMTLLRRDFKVQRLDALERTVERMGELVSHLQEFSADRPEETLTEAQPEKIAREALEVARPRLTRGGRPIRVTSHFESGAPARFDEGFLRELLVNLLLAARDRMPEGGELTVRSEHLGEWTHLRIEFPGSYSADELALLFDPLRKSGTPQLALVLSSARNQVQRWGGALAFEALEPPRRGAAFTLRLPVAVSPTPQRQGTKAAPVSRQRARRVLVVDDDIDNARMMAEVLQREGYLVDAAYSGRQALALWNPGTFDAALLDVLMPDMTGWELAREIRHRSPRAQLAVVTGAEIRGQSRSNLSLVDAVFTKPVDANAVGEFLAHPQPAMP